MALSDDDVNRLAEAFNRTSEEASRLAEAESEAAEKINEAKANVSKAGSELKNSLTSLSKAFLSAEPGFSKYGASLNSAGDAALSLGKNFGLIGIAAGSLVKGLTMAGDAMLKQADNTLKATDTLSKFGAANAFTAEQVRRMGIGAGLTSKTLDQLMKPLASMNGGLTVFGTTAADGAAKFAQMVKVTEQTRKEFQRLGLNDEERIQAQADYLAMMERTGGALMGQQKSADKLQQASLEYTRNLYELSALTGKDIESSKKDMEVARATQEWAIQNNKWERGIQAAKARNDTEEVQRLEKERAAANKLLDTIKRTGDQNAVAAYQMEYLTGAVSAGNTSFQLLGINTTEYIKKIKEGTDVSKEFADEYSDKMQGTIDTFGEIIPFAKDFGKAININQETLTKANKRLMGEEQQSTLMQNAKDRIKDNQFNKGVVAEDTAQKARNALTETERSAKQAIDNLTASINPLMTGFTGTTVAAIALGTSATAAAVALGSIAAGKALGGLPGVGGKASDIAGKAGTNLLKGAKGGLIGSVAGMGLGMAGSAATTAGHEKTGAALDIASTTASYAGTGAMLGSLFGPVGTMIGGIGGGLLGAGMGLYSNRGVFSKETPVETFGGTTAAGEKTVSADMQKILDYIGKHESKGNYNILVGGKTDPKLTNMTIAEVLDYQRQMLQSGFESSAVGKYQIIRKTLLGLVNKGVVQQNDKFDQGTQDKLAEALVRGRGYENYKLGKLSSAQFADNLASEWASLPTASGGSAYAGVGSNRALTDRGSFISMLETAPKAKIGGIFSGPESGFPVTLHGNEAVVPLDPTSIITRLIKTPADQLANEFNIKNAVTASTTNESYEAMNNLVSMLSDKLDNVIYTLKSSNNTQEKLLQYSRV